MGSGQSEVGLACRGVVVVQDYVGRWWYGGVWSYVLMCKLEVVSSTACE